MKAMQRLLQWQAQAKRRQYLIAVLIGMPLIAAGYLLASRFMAAPWPALAAVVGLLALCFWAWKTSNQFDALWLVRQVDGCRAEMENSTDLLFGELKELSTLQQLQRLRVQNRIEAGDDLDLRSPLPWRKIFIAAFAASAIGVLALYWPNTGLPPLLAPPQTAASGEINAPVVLQKSHISIQAPAYTGIAKRTVTSLNIKAPEASRLEWKLSFSAEPEAVDIVFLDGKRLPLKALAGEWRASSILLKSSLYRIEVNRVRLPEDKLYRLQAVKDMPPVLKVSAPDRTLSIAEYQQSEWLISFEAEDDYGLGGAQLRIQLAQGTGENIKFTQSMQTLQGVGSQKQKRYATRINLDALGLAAGDDLIVQMSVSDRRTPIANIRLSSSYILRWPPEDSAEASGVEGMLKKVAPAYFRSQRQIIIDTEKLIADRKKFSKDEYERRSDTIGVDQRLLRLRYGQFLGEESEGFEEDDHDHDSAPPVKQSTSDEILSEFGHTHDIPEAATLLDPETKKLLRAALNEMWQAELHLRQVQPKLALPFENRALALIKKVQQADRIYLARVGNELPPIDEARRLSGDRKNLSQSPDLLIAASKQDLTVTQFWQALSLPYDQTAAPLDFSALNDWINQHQESLPDVLSLLSALDALQQKPQCVACRAEVRKQLWPLVPKPTALPTSRRAPSKSGQRYLDALNKGSQP